MNENVIVEDYEFINPHLEKIDSSIDKSIRDCHNKLIHTFGQLCLYDYNFTKDTIN